MDWKKIALLVLAGALPVLTFGAAAAGWVINPGYGAALFVATVCAIAWVMWVFVGEGVVWLAERKGEGWRKTKRLFQIFVAISYVFFMTQAFQLPPIWNERCAPKIEQFAETTTLDDPQIKQPALIHWFKLTRLSRASYEMIVVGRWPELLNINAIRSDGIKNKIIKRQLQPIGIELVVHEPVGILGVIISPPPKGAQKLDITFECVKNAAQ